MIIAIITLFIISSISLLVIRLASTALIQTGMSQESARFQAFSAMTGVGFTTKESEAVINHPVRRRIIMLLMLVGNIGVPTVVATFVISLITAVESEHWWQPMLVLAAGLTGLAVLATSRYVEKYLNIWLNWGLKKWTNLDVRDYVSLLQLQNGYAVTEMIVESGDWLDGKTLKQAALSQEGILILGIQRHHGPYSGTPHATDMIHAGDTLVLYSLLDHLKELDQRSTASGELAHRRAVAKHVRQLKGKKVSAHHAKPKTRRTAKSGR
jgi:hypothetical protein